MKLKDLLVEEEGEKIKVKVTRIKWLNDDPTEDLPEEIEVEVTVDAEGKISNKSELRQALVDSPKNKGEFQPISAKVGDQPFSWRRI